MGNKKRESQSHDHSLVCSFLQSTTLKIVPKIDGVKIVSKREHRIRGHQASCNILSQERSLRNVAN